jgi:hypothetical protein
MKVGDKMMIHCYKHNGLIYKIWEQAIVLDITDEYLVLGNENVKVTKSDGRSWRTKEPAIIFFYYDRWFNVIAQLKKNGTFYYCNIASPFIIDGNIVKYIDYDLDLRVFPDWGYRILDRNEYNYHKKVLRYSNDLDFIIRSELNALINMKKKKVNPFNKEIVDYYTNLFKKINLNKNKFFK